MTKPIPSHNPSPNNGVHTGTLHSITRWLTINNADVLDTMYRAVHDSITQYLLSSTLDNDERHDVVRRVLHDAITEWLTTHEEQLIDAIRAAGNNCRNCGDAP